MAKSTSVCTCGHNNTQVVNVFCPTGQGGGIDATCSPGSHSIASSIQLAIEKLSGISKDREHAITLDADTGKVLKEDHGSVGDYWEKGESPSVSMPNDLISVGRKIIHIHTHMNEDSSFSDGDWGFFASKQVVQAFVIDRDHIYSLTKPDSYIVAEKSKYSPRQLREAWNDELAVVESADTHGDRSAGDMIRDVNERMSKRFGFTYTTRNKLTLNAKSSSDLPNTLRRDPTRTVGLRRRFQAEILRRLNNLKKSIWNLVVEEDAFGLKPRSHNPMVGNDNPKGCNQYSGPGCSVGLQTSDNISTVADLRKFAQKLQGPELFTHATRTSHGLSDIVKAGIVPGKDGKVSSTSTLVKTGGQIDDHGVRAMPGGYVVFDGYGLSRKDKVDVVSHDEKYPEVAFTEAIPASRIVKVVREVPIAGSGHTIREDYLADYAAKHQGLNDPDVRALPEKYQRWFSLESTNNIFSVNSEESYASVQANITDPTVLKLLQGIRDRIDADDLLEGAVSNENPRGCNQYTGPGCAIGKAYPTESSEGEGIKHFSEKIAFRKGDAPLNDFLPTKTKQLLADAKAQLNTSVPVRGVGVTVHGDNGPDMNWSEGDIGVALHEIGHAIGYPGRRGSENKFQSSVVNPVDFASVVDKAREEYHKSSSNAGTDDFRGLLYLDSTHDNNELQADITSAYLNPRRSLLLRSAMPETYASLREAFGSTHADLPVSQKMQELMSDVATRTGHIHKRVDAEKHGITKDTYEKIADLIFPPVVVRSNSREKYTRTEVKSLPKRLAEAEKLLAESSLNKKDPTTNQQRGFEKQPHITVRYGFTDDDPTQAQQVIRDIGVVRAKLGKLSVFELPEAEVLKLEVDSKDLHRAHKKLELLPHVDTHPNYQPHLTIAYLKPGTASKYLFMATGLDGYELEFNELTFSGSGYEQESVSVNQRFSFQTSAEQTEAFRKWLATEVELQMFGTLEDQIRNAWWRGYIEEGYKQGAGRAFDDTKRPYAKGYAQDESTSDFYRGSKEQFLRSAFAQPVSVDKVKLLAGRVYTDIKGVTDVVATKVQRSLTDGIIQGKSPREVGREMNDVLDAYKNQATTVARTETIRAHAEGQLDAMEKLGVEDVGVAVEWSTSGMGVTALGNPSPCELCAPLSGIVIKVKEARGLIPRHPNCMCSLVPANVGEDTSGQLRSADSIKAAFRKSIKSEIPKGSKRTIAQQKAKSKWKGADKTIGKKRPKSLVGNTPAPHFGLLSTESQLLQQQLALTMLDLALNS